ncbi:hypothetical protein NDU88_000698 [Pleurodeles waltl]|uniref:Uncharacterized protein n=1 Tax=Pleurodeles waltl TaxID=8319 RepID=A0AAV7PAF2_PLEWA|nr:hypothetical protein NDU88_000698 [Pleurodeles waltl]
MWGKPTTTSTPRGSAALSLLTSPAPLDICLSLQLPALRAVCPSLQPPALRAVCPSLQLSHLAPCYSSVFVWYDYSVTPATPAAPTALDPGRCAAALHHTDISLSLTRSELGPSRDPCNGGAADKEQGRREEIRRKVGLLENETAPSS